MKILFDIGHPAHVHLFKNFIFYLKNKGHEVTVLTRDKEITNVLLSHYKIDYTCISTSKGNGLISMISELVSRNVKMFFLHLKRGFDVSFGTSTSIAHLTFLTLGRVKSYNFGEDDDHIVPLHANSTYPFTSKIMVPKGLQYNRWKKKRVVVSSYHELAYLHPDVFTPDKRILDKYGLEPKKYVIFRLSALNAHHDVGALGISDLLRKKITHELIGFDVLESFEGKSGNKVDPWDMHHLLYFAKMLISDSQTMTAEGAVLGVPSIRINSFVNKISYLNDLENDYKLCFGWYPHQESEIIQTIKSLMENQDLEKEWNKRRENLLTERVNYNDWMIKFFENGMSTDKSLN